MVVNKGETMKELFLIRGVSGCGKTSLTKTLLRQYDKHISTDDFFMVDGVYDFDVSKLKHNHLQCQKQVGEWLSQGKRVFVHNTFTEEWEMTPYFILGETFGYKVYTLVVENRHQSENTHSVPSETITKQKERFDIVL